VRLSDDRTVVAVTEGRIEFLATPKDSTPPVAPATSVNSPQKRAQLAARVAAGEAVSYRDNGDLQALPEKETSIATAWLEGRRQYRNEPLRYVLADVDRYTGQRIELTNDGAGDLRFTGTLNLDDSTAWLRGLAVALPVIVSNKDGALLITRRLSPEG
jgi:ferric-dicitrate binding protein FerR (iron transport regulator)